MDKRGAVFVSKEDNTLELGIGDGATLLPRGLVLILKLLSVNTPLTLPRASVCGIIDGDTNESDSGDAFDSIVCSLLFL